MTPVYAWAAGQDGARIAVTGTTGSFFQFPLHGRELQNEVRLIGRHGDHGSFTPITDCAELLEAVAGDTHAVVTPYLDIWDPFRPLDAPELACLRTAGAREVLASGPVARPRARAMTTVSVVVPAFQEARRIPRLIRAIQTGAAEDLARAGLELREVIVVDDGSSDGTGAVLAAAAETEPLIRR